MSAASRPGRRPAAAHGDADVGLPQGWRVVDPVAGHRHNAVVGAQRPDEAKLVLGLDAGVDVGLLHRLTQLGVLEPLERGARQRGGIPEPEHVADRSGGGRVVAGDHQDPDAGALTTTVVAASCLLGACCGRLVTRGGGSSTAERTVCMQIVNQTTDFVRLADQTTGYLAGVAPLDAGDTATLDVKVGRVIVARSLLDESTIVEFPVTSADQQYIIRAQPPGGTTQPNAPPSSFPGVHAALSTLDVPGALPDPASDAYRTVSEVPVFDEIPIFNTRLAPKRRSVTLTGVRLVWDESHPDLLAYASGDALDIRDLTMVADTVVVARPLQFPGTNVTIRARVLEFAGDGRIETTPVAWSAAAMSPRPWTNDADPNDHAVYPGQLVDGKVVRGPAAKGAVGGDAGNITLHIRELRLPKDGAKAKRFVAKGAQGQAGEPGGLCPRDPKDTALAPLTREDLADAFAEYFPVSKSLDSWVWPDGALGLFPSRVTSGDQPGNVVFARIFCADQRFVSQSFDAIVRPGTYAERLDGEVTGEECQLHLWWDGKPKPLRYGAVFHPDYPAPPKLVAPPDAYPGGCPGDGGAGGVVSCNLAWTGLVDVSVKDFGSPGAPTAAVPGGISRTRAPANAVNILISRTTWAASDYVGTGLNVFANIAPPQGASAPALTGSHGADGDVRSGSVPMSEVANGTTGIVAPVGQATTWLEPGALDAVMRCATDTFRMGHREQAWRLIEPYRAEILASSESATAAHAVQIEAMRHRLVANLDYTGHPPGYLPRLSALASYYDNQAIRLAAINMVCYASDAIDAFDKVQQATAVETHSRDAVGQQLAVARVAVAAAAATLKQAAADLDMWTRKVQAQDGQVQHLVDQLSVDAKDEVERANIFKGVMHLIGGALAVIPVFQPYLGLAGSVASNVGEIDLTKPVGDQVGSTFGAIGQKVAQFLTDNKSLIISDATDPQPGSAGQQNGDDLDTEIRKAQADLTPEQKKTVSVRELLETSLEGDPSAKGSGLGDLTVAQQTAAAAVAKWHADVSSAVEALKTAPPADVPAAKQALAAIQAKRETFLEPLATSADVEAKAMTARLAELKQRKADLEASLKRSEADQETRRKQVGATCDRLAGMGKGLADLGTGLAALMRPVTPTDPAVQQLVAQKLAGNSEAAVTYNALKQTFAKLVAEQQAVVARLVRSQAALVSGNALIASSLDQLVSIADSLQHRAGLADARTRQHLVQLGDRGRELARTSVDTFLAALRYELIAALPPDTLDVDDIAEKVAKTVQSAPTTQAAPSATAPPRPQDIVNNELWAQMCGIAGDAIKTASTLAGRQPTRTTSVTLQTHAQPATERERDDTRILDELSTTGSSTVWAIEDLHVETDYRWRSARILDVRVTDVTLEPPPSRKGFYIDIDVRHSGSQLIYERMTAEDDPAYYFFQSGQDDPIVWSVRATTDGNGKMSLPDAKRSDASGKSDALPELLRDMLAKPTDGPNTQISLKPYDPGLFAQLVLEARPDVLKDEPKPRITELTIQVDFNFTQHEAATPTAAEAATRT
jgi:hypothetical protein